MIIALVPNQSSNMVRFILTLLLSLPLRSSCFSPAARPRFASDGLSGSVRPTATAVVGVGHSSSWSSMTLMAKKRRRRKSAPSPTTTQTDDLPDFDDGEAEFVEVKDEPIQIQSVSAAMAAMPPSASVTPVKRGAGLNSQLAEEVGGNVEGLDEDTILEAMRGKAGNRWEPPQSIQDTLQDRRLEKFMDFDKMIEQDGGGAGDAMELPDFDEVISRRKQKEAMQEGRVEDAAMLIDTSDMGKKAARNAERKAAAMQREIELEEEKNPFEDFQYLDIVKLLENGAWLGIGLLVLWEVYINSPLFDRASPLIPAVF